MKKLSDNIERKFVDTVDVSDYEILTDSGYSDIDRVMKTIEYEIWHLELDNGYSLECADDHIVFYENFIEVYVKDLSPGDVILTEVGPAEVKTVYKTDVSDNMYDVQVNNEDHRYYTNGILSHNTLVLGNLAVRAFTHGCNVGVATVELSKEKYVKRLGSNLLGIPQKLYKDFSSKTSLGMVKKKIDELKTKTKELGVFEVQEWGTGSASSIDIENYFLKLEQRRGIKFDVIVIDYLNLLRPFKADTTLYLKIKTISEELRAIAKRNYWTVVSATQVKVTDFNSDLRLDSAAESSGLVATVDSLFGLMSEPGSTELKIKNIANRDEGHMESYKLYNKDFNYFRIDEKDGDDSEYWSDDGDELEKAMMEDYKDSGLLSMEEVKAMDDPDGMKEFESMKSATDFDTKKEITKTPDVDYDDILQNID